MQIRLMTLFYFDAQAADTDVDFMRSLETVRHALKCPASQKGVIPERLFQDLTSTELTGRSEFLRSVSIAAND